MSDSRYGDMMLAIFDGRDPGGVLWQPRLEFWYKVNQKRGTLPAHLRAASLLDVYDYCHASVRYFGNGLRRRYRTVQMTETWSAPTRLRRRWETPLGVLDELVGTDEWQLSSHNIEYRVKSPDDFRILEYMRQDEEWYWDQAAFDEDVALMGGRGVPQYYFRRSPIQGLFIEEMGFEATLYMMHDEPATIACYVAMETEADDAMYRVICASPAPIVNFGENIDAYLDPPPIWNTHLVPYYRKRAAQLHGAGKKVYIHVDGAMKPLLPYLRDCPWDAIEAATPLPQGDVTEEEIKQGLGDLILLDGIPALFFLTSFPVSDLVECCRRVVDLFHPRLVLGISDEIPPDGDIERVRLVGEMVRGMR